MRRRLRKLWHRIILWYIEDVAGGAFHTKPYGPDGRYIVSVTDEEYHWLNEFIWNNRTSQGNLVISREMR